MTILERSGSIFTFDIVLILGMSILVFPYIFYKIKINFYSNIKTNLTINDYYIIIILLTYIIIEGYQQYFWTKNNKIGKENVIPKIILDNFIKKNDSWIYIYNFIYYIVFGFIVIILKDYKHFAIIILGAIFLLCGLTLIWYLFPNIVPERMETNNYFMKKTQLIDTNTNNALPSAHVAFAVYSYYLLRPVIGKKSLLIPILISISCLKTTQHLCLDVIAGALYTIIIYNIILKKINPSVFV